MKKCEYEDLIDDYLRNKLSEADTKKFEEHYFNCSSCFQKMTEKEELLAVIKNKGYEIFQNEFLTEETKRSPWYEPLISLLTPRQWALAAVSAALILVVVLAVIPIMKSSSPQFFINEDLVRGQSITLISPVIDIKNVPSEFKWKNLGKDVEYKIYIYNDKLLWTATTKQNSITLPDEVKKLMTSDQKYSWQVKAFSPEGGLIAVSSRVQFKITSTK